MTDFLVFDWFGASLMFDWKIMISIHLPFILSLIVFLRVGSTPLAASLYIIVKMCVTLQSRYFPYQVFVCVENESLLCFKNYFRFLFACTPPRRERNARVRIVKIIGEKGLNLAKQRKSFTGEAQSCKYCKYCAFIRWKGNLLGH